MDCPCRSRPSVVDPGSCDGCARLCPRVAFRCARECGCSRRWRLGPSSGHPCPVHPACSWLPAWGGCSPTRSWPGTPQPRLGLVAAALVGLLGVLAALSSGWQAVREYRAVAGLPCAASGARNVVLIVWDTVRAYNVSAYGYYRDTTPNLTRGGLKGRPVQPRVAPAPWTYPSHSVSSPASGRTGSIPSGSSRSIVPTQRWPSIWPLAATKRRGSPRIPDAAAYETRAGSRLRPFRGLPVLARASQPYRSWEMAPRKILTLGAYYDPSLAAYYEKKWVTLQSRGAREINDEFLGWLDGRGSDRPSSLS